MAQRRLPPNFPQPLGSHIQQADALRQLSMLRQEIVAKQPDLKPALAKRHLKLFDQLDRVHRRSLGLLADSFGHIRVILDRIQPPQVPAAKPSPAPPPKN